MDNPSINRKAQTELYEEKLCVNETETHIKYPSYENAVKNLKILEEEDKKYE